LEDGVVDSGTILLKSIPTGRFDLMVGRKPMFGNHLDEHKRLIALAVLALGFGFGLHDAGAAQTDAVKVAPAGRMR